MTTGIVQCNFCERVVKERDAHGWLDVRVWVTKPTKDAVEQMRMDPSMAQMLDRQGITGSDLPALVGGDFCSLDHLVRFYQAQAMLESQETTDDSKIAFIPESDIELTADDPRTAMKEEMVTRRELDGEVMYDDPWDEDTAEWEDRYGDLYNAGWDDAAASVALDGETQCVDAPDSTDDDAPPEDDGTLPGDGWLIVGDEEGA